VQSHKIHQNTARIACLIDNMVICSSFLRAVFGVIYHPLMNRYRPPSQVPTA
jgi:hypothetical protein